MQNTPNSCLYIEILPQLPLWQKLSTQGKFHFTRCVTTAMGILAEVRQISHFLIDLSLVLPGFCILISLPRLVQLIQMATTLFSEYILPRWVPTQRLSNTPEIPFAELYVFKCNSIPAESYPNYFLQHRNCKVTEWLSLPLFHKQLPSTAVISGTSVRRVSFGLTEWFIVYWKTALRSSGCLCSIARTKPHLAGSPA